MAIETEFTVRPGAVHQLPRPVGVRACQADSAGASWPSTRTRSSGSGSSTSRLRSTRLSRTTSSAGSGTPATTIDRFVAILPVGPMPQYELAAQHDQRGAALSRACAHVQHGRVRRRGRRHRSGSWPGSFQRAMLDRFFALIDPEPTPAREPDPFSRPRTCSPTTRSRIEDLGGADVCYGGIGWCGHIAFWESHLGEEFAGDLEAYKQAGARLVELHPMTIMQNALHSFGGDWSWVPPKANTIGPREILGARHRSFWLDGDLGGGVSWQRFIARLVAHGPVSEFVPGSILQTAPTDYTILGGVADDVEIAMALVVDVVCLGILVADVIARPVDELPHGAVSLMDEVSLHGGGCALNTATGLGRLGLSVAVVGKVGEDTFGDFVVGLLDERGLDTRGVLRDPAVPTSATVVLVDRAGERSFLHLPGANGALSADELVAGQRLSQAGRCTSPARWSCPRSTELRPPDCSRRHDDAVSTPRSTPSTTPPVAGSGSSRACPTSTCSRSSLAEAQGISGEREPARAAAWFRDRGVAEVALTLGPDGCYVAGAEFEGDVPAFPRRRRRRHGSGRRLRRRDPLREARRLAARRRREARQCRRRARHDCGRRDRGPPRPRRDAGFRGSGGGSVNARLNRLFAADGRCFDVAVDHGFFGEGAFLAGIEDHGAGGRDARRGRARRDPALTRPGAPPPALPGPQKPALVLRTDVANVYGAAASAAPVQRARRRCRRAGAAARRRLRGRQPAPAARISPSSSTSASGTCRRCGAACDPVGMPLMVEPLVMQPSEQGPTGSTATWRRSCRSCARRSSSAPTSSRPTRPTTSATTHRVIEIAGDVPVLVRGGGERPTRRSCAGRRR